MQTERVTFLTSRDHKAALDAYAASNGKSVGHVVREATARYMAQPVEPSAEDDALRLLAQELNDAAPRIQASLERSSATLQALHAEMDEFFLTKGIR
jgi:signal transduction protein with GAF and PtsI domain